MRSIKTSRSAACPAKRWNPLTNRRAGAVRIGSVSAAAAAAVPAPALAQSGAATALAQARDLLDTGDIAAASFSALMILFVLAVLIESALAVIFNWRLFLEVFNGRGVKTLVAIVVSAVVVSTFDLDLQVFEKLLTTYGIEVGEGEQTVSLVLTTLILAGGSGGVNRILVALGYREAAADRPRVPKAPKGRAWVAVRVERSEAVGPIEVHIQQIRARTDDSPPAIAGIVAPVGFWQRIRSVFLLDRNRFPPAGGYDVLPDFEYAIKIVARNRDGEPIDCDLNDKTYCFADGAIVDFTVVL